MAKINNVKLYLIFIFQKILVEYQSGITASLLLPESFWKSFNELTS